MSNLASVSCCCRRRQHNPQCCLLHSWASLSSFSTVTTLFCSASQFHQGALFVRVRPAGPLLPRTHSNLDWSTSLPCNIFGVSPQINFLTDEAGDCGKCANPVISRLHYIFDHLSLGEREVYLTADSYGQNKNNAMIQYLMWSTLTGTVTSPSR